MDRERADRALWDAVVAAERQVTQRRAEFRRDAVARHQILAAALGSGSVWERGSALSFLQSFHDDVPELVAPLVDLALSDSWALSARHVISAGRRDVVQPEVERIISGLLPAADALDFRRFAELLAALEAWDSLRLLLQRARVSNDPETQEVDRDFAEKYGPMLITP